MEAATPTKKRGRTGLTDFLNATCCSFLEQDWRQVESVVLNQDITPTEVFFIYFVLLVYSNFKQAFESHKQFSSCDFLGICSSCCLGFTCASSESKLGHWGHL